MKLILENFRCYEHAEFDFGENGLCLLSGQSGAGKTTLMLAIQFCLYGTGRKVQTHGKTSCKVELYFKDFHVLRSKVPNRLIVNDIYEDDTAQEIINEKFGNSFDVCGYVDQRASNTFILMSPTEKLAFLEKTYINELATLKAQIKILISEYNGKLIGASSDHTAAVKMLEAVKIDFIGTEDVQFPIKCKSSQRDIAIKNNDIKITNNSILKRKALKLLQKLQSEKASISLVDTAVKAYTEHIHAYEHDKDILKVEIDNITKKLLPEHELIKIQKTLDHIKISQNITRLTNEIENDTINLENIIQTSTTTLNQELSEYKGLLWTDKPQDLDETLELYNLYINDNVRVNSLIKKRKDCKSVLESMNLGKDSSNVNLDIEMLKEELRILEAIEKDAKSIYECPRCKSHLIIKNGTCDIYSSVIVNVDNTKSSNELRGKIKDLEILYEKIKKYEYQISLLDADIISLRDSYEDDITDNTKASEIKQLKLQLERRLQENKDCETKIKDLEKRLALLRDKEKGPYRTYFSTIDIKQQDLKKAQTLCVEVDLYEGDESELVKLLSEQKILKNNHITLIKKYSKIEDDILKKQEQIASLKKTHELEFTQIRDIVLVDVDIVNITNDIDALDAEYNELIEIKNKIGKWLEHQTKLEKLKEYETNVEKFKAEEDSARLKYQASLSMRDSIIEAESLYMSITIDTINTHAQLYLDIFFQDDPISIKLTPIKQTKTAGMKHQLNLEIEYKGMDCDISMLSGGELSRVVLAYTLALAEMFNLPMILLDECTANLDQDLTTNVFTGIRDNFANKMVVIVAHQIITGEFDKIINL